MNSMDKEVLYCILKAKTTCQFSVLKFSPWYLVSLVARVVKNLLCLQCRRPRFDPRVRKIPWRRKWQPTPVFLPRESHGQKNLGGYRPWNCRESDTAKRLILALSPEFFEETGGGKQQNCIIFLQTKMLFSHVCTDFFTEKYYGIYCEALYTEADQRLNFSSNLVLVGALGSTRHWVHHRSPVSVYLLPVFSLWHEFVHDSDDTFGELFFSRLWWCKWKIYFFTSPGPGEFRLSQEVLMKIDSSYTLILSVSNSRLGLLDQASVSVAHWSCPYGHFWHQLNQSHMPCINEVVWECGVKQTWL